MRSGRLRSRRVPGLVLAVATAFALIAAWLIYSAPRSQAARNREAMLESARDSVAATPASSAAIGLDVMAVSREAAADIVRRSGVLEPARSVRVAAEIEGRILEVSAREHERVEAGTLLVRLDAELARAATLRARAQHALAASSLRRQKALGERDIGSVADLDRSHAEERAAYAALLEARARLARTEIRAPFAGVVNELHLDPGAYVVPGTPIAQILDTDTVEIEIGVSDLQVAGLAPGDRVQLRVESLGGEPLQASIERLGRASDDETRRYPVVIRVANPDGRLLPGMLASVELELGSAPAIRIPRRAVEREFELDYVFVIEGENQAGRAKRRRVVTRPVPFRPDLVEVTEGLEGGERIAVSNIAALQDGSSVFARAAERTPTR